MRVKCCLKLTQSCQNLMNIRVPSKRNFRHQCSIDGCTNESHWCCSGCEMQRRRQQSENIATPNNDEEDFWDNIMEDCASFDWSTILESQESHNGPQVKKKRDGLQNHQINFTRPQLKKNLIKKLRKSCKALINSTFNAGKMNGHYFWKLQRRHCKLEQGSVNISAKITKTFLR